MNAKDQLIVALDYPSLEESLELVDRLGSAVDIYKVGSQLFTACGPVAVRHLISRNKKVFLDLKFHDIPNTVDSAIRSAIAMSVLPHQVLDQNENKIDVKQGLLLCTVHIQGGEEMLSRAVKAAREEATKRGVKPPQIVGITVLTSDSKADNIHKLVLERAKSAQRCGLDGIVCSAQEVPLIRQELGDDFIIVTPGIRPQSVDQGDQKRVATPAAAIKSGSNYLVVGRPITQADDPVSAAHQILEEMQSTKI